MRTVTMYGGRRSRTLAALSSLLMVVSLLGSVRPVVADGGDPPPEPELYQMVFPVVGDNHYSDTWGACRGTNCSRSHEGVDIMADKMVPVVAVADGTVGWMHNELGVRCCAMGLYHDDGWVSYYIHLNNDTPGTDDGMGWGFADGIESGVHVVAGQLIGWVGDSGNAENTSPHLHFELHQPGIGPINPTPHVDAATRIAVPLGTYNGRFHDDDTSVHEGDIDRLAEAGITKGCNPPTNDMYCPDRKLTRGEIAAFLRRFLSLPPTEVDYFADDAGSIFEGDINALAEAGIAFGCTETDYCPDIDLLRGEMAELLVRTFGYTNPENADYFVDDAGHQFEESINKLKTSGVTKGCDPPDNTRFCPDRALSRAEMATFIIRALDLEAAAQPPVDPGTDPGTDPGPDPGVGDPPPPPPEGDGSGEVATEAGATEPLYIADKGVS